MDTTTVYKWRTAAAGVMAFVVSLATALKAMRDSDPSTTADWNLVAATLLTMIGLLTARDSKITDEEAGAETSPATIYRLRQAGKLPPQPPM